MPTRRASRGAAVLVALGLIVMARPTAADTVSLKNGDRLTGEIVHLVDGKLTLKTEYAGDVVIDWTKVASVSATRELPVILVDKSELRGKLDVTPDGKMQTTTPAGASATFGPEQVVAIAPPPPPPEFRYKGGINLGARIFDGSTNVKSATARVDLEGRVERVRGTLQGGWDYAEDEGDLTQRRTFGFMKLDMFLTKKLYAYTSAFFENDFSKQLQLRSVLSAGLGYQWVDEPGLAYFTEGGIAYIDEDRRRGAADTSDLAGRLAHKLDWVIVGPEKEKGPPRVTFFHAAEYLPSFEDDQDYLIRTRTGIRTALAEGWAALFEVDFDYDNKPEGDAEREETAYIFAVGYTFGN